MGVCLPRGPPSLGVESPHDVSTPPLFVCGVESSYHDLLPPLLSPFGVELSSDDSTPQLSLWWVKSSGEDLTPPSSPWQPLPGFSSTPEASRPPSSNSTPWGSGSTPEALRPPNFSPTPQGSAHSQPWRPPFFPPFYFLTPMAAPRPPLVGCPGVGFPAAALAGPCTPL